MQARVPLAAKLDRSAQGAALAPPPPSTLASTPAPSGHRDGAALSRAPRLATRLATPAEPATLAVVQRILGRIAAASGSSDVERLLGHQATLRVIGSRLEVRARTGFVAEAIRTKFGAALQDAARDELGAGAQVVIGLDGATAATAAPAQRAIQHPGPANPRTESRYRLEDYIVGESNRLAYSAALTLSDPDSARNYSPLVLHGPCGVGKTHLLQAIAARFREKKPGASIRCLTAENFTNDFISAVRANKVDQFRKAYRGLDLLAIDDIQFLASKEATQQELLHTFNHIDLGGARVVLVSDEHPRDVRQLSAALVSRFMSGMVVKIDAPEMPLRERITQALAARRGVRLDGAAVALVASRCGAAGHSASVRDVEGALLRIEACRTLMPDLCDPGGQIGLNLVRAALGLREDPSRPRRPVKVQAICSHVCRELGVALEEVYGRGRHARVVLARSLCAALSRELTTSSFPEIARAMGRPGHSSVVTACKRLSRQMDLDHPGERGADLPAPYAGLGLRGLFERLRDDIARSAAGA